MDLDSRPSSPAAGFYQQFSKGVTPIRPSTAFVDGVQWGCLDGPVVVPRNAQHLMDPTKRRGTWDLSTYSPQGIDWTKGADWYNPAVHWRGWIPRDAIGSETIPHPDPVALGASDPLVTPVCLGHLIPPKTLAAAQELNLQLSEICRLVVDIKQYRIHRPPPVDTSVINSHFQSLEDLAIALCEFCYGMVDLVGFCRWVSVVFHDLMPNITNKMQQTFEWVNYSFTGRNLGYLVHLGLHRHEFGFQFCIEHDVPFYYPWLQKYQDWGHLQRFDPLRLAVAAEDQSRLMGRSQTFFGPYDLFLQATEDYTNQTREKPQQPRREHWVVDFEGWSRRRVRPEETTGGLQRECYWEDVPIDKDKCLRVYQKWRKKSGVEEDEAPFQYYGFDPPPGHDPRDLTIYREIYKFACAPSSDSVINRETGQRKPKPPCMASKAPHPFADHSPINTPRGLERSLSSSPGPRKSPSSPSSSLSSVSSSSSSDPSDTSKPPADDDAAIQDYIPLESLFDGPATSARDVPTAGGNPDDMDVQEESQTLLAEAPELNLDTEMTAEDSGSEMPLSPTPSLLEWEASRLKMHGDDDMALTDDQAPQSPNRSPSPKKSLPPSPSVVGPTNVPTEPRAMRLGQPEPWRPLSERRNGSPSLVSRMEVDLTSNPVCLPRNSQQARTQSPVSSTLLERLQPQPANEKSSQPDTPQSVASRLSNKDASTSTSEGLAEQPRWRSNRRRSSNKNMDLSQPENVELRHVNALMTSYRDSRNGESRMTNERSGKPEQALGKRPVATVSRREGRHAYGTSRDSSVKEAGEGLSIKRVEGSSSTQWGSWDIRHRTPVGTSGWDDVASTGWSPWGEVMEPLGQASTSRQQASSPWGHSDSHRRSWDQDSAASPISTTGVSNSASASSSSKRPPSSPPSEHPRHKGKHPRIATDRYANLRAYSLENYINVPQPYTYLTSTNSTVIYIGNGHPIEFKWNEEYLRYAILLFNGNECAEVKFRLWALHASLTGREVVTRAIERHVPFRLAIRSIQTFWFKKQSYSDMERQGHLYLPGYQDPPIMYDPISHQLWNRYVAAVMSILARPHARALVFRGGLVARLVKEFAPQGFYEGLLSGPSSQVTLHQRGLTLVDVQVTDDEVSEFEVATVLGVTTTPRGKGGSYSIWPPSGIFEERFRFWEGEWTSECEIWFQDELTFQKGHAVPKTMGQWRRDLHHKNYPQLPKAYARISGPSWTAALDKLKREGAGDWDNVRLRDLLPS